MDLVVIPYLMFLNIIYKWFAFIVLKLFYKFCVQLYIALVHRKSRNKMDKRKLTNRE